MKTLLEVPKAKKGEKKRVIRVTVFPQGGGTPYAVDVEPDDDGMFNYTDSQSAKVMPGTLWMEDGRTRGIVNEGNPVTVSPWMLEGDPVISSQAIHGLISNNLWVQRDEIARRKSPWRSPATWGMLGLGVGIILALIWLVSTTGAGFEELKDAINALDISTGTTSSGHQDISPRRG